MRGIARLDDRTDGICSHPSHIVPIPVGGTIVTASTTMIVNGRGVAREDDEVLTDCGHTDLIQTFSSDTQADGRPTARLNDSVGKLGIYSATIISASDDTANNV
jgi:hypothetical protein